MRRWRRSCAQRNLQLPAGFNPRTVALARQWRQDAGDDDAAIVRRALDWIRRDFAYTLASSLAGRNAVDQFLFVDKRGYCEQFSSSFVVLMRAAGIPARVVGGYAGAEYNPIGEYWIVRRSDAHAWAEVWLRRPRLGARGSHRGGCARTRVRHARRSRGAPATCSAIAAADVRRRRLDVERVERVRARASTPNASARCSVPSAWATSTPRCC